MKIRILLPFFYALSKKKDRIVVFLGDRNLVFLDDGF